MRIEAAVTRSPTDPMTIEEIELEEPRPNEVLVRIVGTGVCHTDMVMKGQGLPTPQPVVLGHEGSGVVERVGQEVTNVEVGDHVTMSFNSCGRCPSCTDDAPSYCYAFFPLNFLGARIDGSTPLSKGEEVIHGNIFGQSSFATHAICNQRNVVKVDKDVDLYLLGPLGCGILTGAGAVFNSLAVKEKSTVAVFGTGAVGLSAIMAAKVAGARAIIAVDLNAERLTLATQLGATHTINPSESDIGESLQKICQGGVDFAIDTTANMTVMNAAVANLAPRGSCGLIGATAPGVEINIDINHLMGGGRKIQGIVEGGADPAQLIPELVSLYKHGKFPFDKLISFYDFKDINQAFADAASGAAIKPVLRIGTI